MFTLCDQVPEYVTAKIHDLLDAVPKHKWRQHKQHRVALGQQKVCKSRWLKLERLIEDGTQKGSDMWAGKNNCSLPYMKHVLVCWFGNLGLWNFGNLEIA